MTINEIQSTLDQLKERHPNLNEGLVLTLLEAGGWDKVDIKDAIALFKVNSLNSTLPHEDKIALPENPELLLSAHNEVIEEGAESIVVNKAPEVIVETKVEEKLVESKEKESLVVSLEEAKPKDEENYIPHDLPLKPFEASPHIWQFSKYKDVFYGNTPAPTPSKVEVRPKVEIEKVVEIPIVETPKVVPVPVPEIKLSKVPLTKKDEGIVALGALLALVAVLLIVYMYSHGRL